MLVSILLVCGCQASSPDSAGDDDGPGPDGFSRLVNADWSLPAATETYLCVRKTITTDTWISSIRPIAPSGTHHTVLMVGPPDAPDGTVECESTLSKPAIYASGVGTDALDFPTGVAVHLKPGQQLLLNLHLFNTSDEPLDGTSGIEILETTEAEVVHEAGVVLVGKAQGLVVPPGASTQTGLCTTPANTTVFAVAPHMHLLGTHMKVDYADATGANALVLHDEPYTFDEQKFHLLPSPLVTKAGGHVTVACSYMNPSGAPVAFGEHTEDEMCYALSFVYPPPAVDTCTQ